MSQATAPENIEKFLQEANRTRFQRETGYSAQLVSRAKRQGAFPAHWFWSVRSYCYAHGLEVPEHLFKGHPDAPGEAAA